MSDIEELSENDDQMSDCPTTVVLREHRDSDDDLPNLQWSRMLLHLERSIILRDYQMAVLNTLGGAYAATKRTAGALILSVRKEQVAGAHPTQSAKLSIQARIHSAVNIGLLGCVKEARTAIRACIMSARDAHDEELEHHCRTSYKWMCEELTRSGEFRMLPSPSSPSS
jgi:hypothetical protein